MPIGAIGASILFRATATSSASTRVSTTRRHREGGRAPELRRVLAGEDRELAWLRETLHADVIQSVVDHAPGHRVLDIGCGTGDFLASAVRAGFEAEGLEPAEEAAGLAREQGLTVHTQSLEAFCDGRGADAELFDAVVLLNVLEHVPQPVETINRCRTLLREGGIIWIRVPNDFNPLQAAAREQFGLPEYWVYAPDHINYFDTNSLPALVRKLSFEIVDLECDFPMELFLFLGMNYVGDPVAGDRAHQMRVQLEMEVSQHLRRTYYRLMAEHGFGRNVRVAARLMSA